MAKRNEAVAEFEGSEQVEGSEKELARSEIVDGVSTSQVSGVTEGVPYEGTVLNFHEVEAYELFCEEEEWKPGKDSYDSMVLVAINDYSRRRQLQNLRLGVKPKSGGYDSRKIASEAKRRLESGEVDDDTFRAAMLSIGVDPDSVKRGT